MQLGFCNTLEPKNGYGVFVAVALVAVVAWIGEHEVAVRHAALLLRRRLQAASGESP